MESSNNHVPRVSHRITISNGKSLMSISCPVPVTPSFTLLLSVFDQAHIASSSLLTISGNAPIIYLRPPIMMATWLTTSRSQQRPLQHGTPLPTHLPPKLQDIRLLSVTSSLLTSYIRRCLKSSISPNKWLILPQYPIPQLYRAIWRK